VHKRAAQLRALRGRRRSTSMFPGFFVVLVCFGKLPPAQGCTCVGLSASFPTNTVMHDDEVASMMETLVAVLKKVLKVWAS
jgi:hypothetical protein